jgi:predicted neutral ceramidase superfamily lipid hydrolase
MLLRSLKSLGTIINIKTLIVTVVAVISTHFCGQYGFTAKFPDLLIGIAIVFPVVFSIGAAFNRRESALQRLSEFKGHLIAIYYASVHWPSENKNSLNRMVREQLTEVMLLLKKMLKDKKKSDWVLHEKQMYACFSRLSLMGLEFRKCGVQSSEISRLNQYISKIIIAFDGIKAIYKYRTPVTLRMYSKVFIYSFPVLYGPYFAATMKDYSPYLVYVMPVLYSFILVSLDNIQDHLEHPFDEMGEDDVKIDLDEEMSAIL